MDSIQTPSILKQPLASVRKLPFVPLYTCVSRWAWFQVCVLLNKEQRESCFCRSRWNGSAALWPRSSFPCNYQNICVALACAEQVGDKDFSLMPDDRGASLQLQYTCTFCVVRRLVICAK